MKTSETKPRIQYKAGYKYQLCADYNIQLPFIPEVSIEIVGDFYSITRSGMLLIKKGYAWNGASGPAVDTKNFMRGSLIHDCLYQMLRENQISPHRKTDADKLLYDICIQDGMNTLRAWWVFKAVSLFGKSSTLSNNINSTIFAP